MDEVSIQHGADVDPVDKDGFTPLHAAAAAGALLVVQGFSNLLFQCAIILKRPSTRNIPGMGHRGNFDIVPLCTHRLTY